MTDKIQADSIVIVLHRNEFGWGGELIVNGNSSSGATAGSAEGVLDSVWSGTFHDALDSEAVYTTGGDEWLTH